MALRDAGFFAREEIELDGVRVRPIDVSSRILLGNWSLADDEPDLTVMRVLVEGVKDGRTTRYLYDLLDRYDEVSGVHSMARTTGYTATAMLRLLGRGLVPGPGVVPPERIGREAASFEFVLAELAERGVVCMETVEVSDRAEPAAESAAESGDRAR